MNIKTNNSELEKLEKENGILKEEIEKYRKIVREWGDVMGKTQWDHYYSGVSDERNGRVFDEEYGKMYGLKDRSDITKKSYRDLLKEFNE